MTREAALTKEEGLTDEQLSTLRHMLGIDDPWMREPKPYRNYYCANPGDSKLHGLLGLGMVTLYSAQGGYEWFSCTDAGVAAACASHRSIRKSKAARVYDKFLSVRECCPDLTFRSFLTDHQFDEIRRSA